MPDLQRIAGYAGAERSRVVVAPNYNYFTNDYSAPAITHYYSLTPLPIAFGKVESEAQRATQLWKEVERLLLLIITILSQLPYFILLFYSFF